MSAAVQCHDGSLPCRVATWGVRVTVSLVKGGEGEDINSPWFPVASLVKKLQWNW